MSVLLLLASVAFVQDSAKLTLSQVVDRALSTHPTVAVARAQRDHASAEVGEATATRLPRLNLDAGMNQFQEPMVVAPLHGFDPRHPPLFDRTLIQSGLSAGWTLVDFGSRAGYVRSERALADAAEVAVSSAESRLVQQTLVAYLDVLTARQTLAAQDQRLAALSLESNRVRQLLEQGKAARLEELRVDAEVKRAQADRIATAARLESAERALADIADLSYPAIRAARFVVLRLADTTAIDTASAAAAALAQRARRTNGDVRELEHRVRAADAALAAIRATGLPELRLSGAYIDRGRASGNFHAEWQLGLSASYAVYGGGSHESTVRKTAAEARGAAEQLRLARLNVDEAVYRALSTLREAHAQVAALLSAVDESAEVARIERLALDVGSGTQSEYLEAEANVLRSRAALIQARDAEISARVELASITGELSRDWLAHSLETAP